ncbi:MAG: Cof-type HAD-IIB family hydrolase [Acholeplasmatales bacterium]|nr:Cof-type HAD-IIB family hydrolase [Acholeplasmatales bacterium]
MIKIVTIDLDGTLFDNVKNISKQNIEAIKKCKELGVKIVIATGRPISGVMPVLKRLGLTTTDDYCIIYNGSKVLNVGTKEEIFSTTITGKTVKELYDESLRLNVNFHAFRKNEELITPKHNPYTDVEATINGIDDILFDIKNVKDDDEFLKAMMVDDKDNLDMVEKNINPIYNEKYSMVRSAKIFLEFLNKETDKGKALEQLAKYLDVNMKDTMAIGDAGNDISMIKRAGLGVAMKNSFKEVLDICDFVTLSNEESGVAYALHKFIIDK